MKIEFNDKTIKTCLREEVKVLHVPKNVKMDAVVVENAITMA